MSIRDLVHAFYAEVWDANSPARAREILHPALEFRGSLGPQKAGPEGFIAYLTEVHTALTGFRCEIVSLVCEGEKAAARMRFSGHHVGPMHGVAPTGREIVWAGAAFFEAEEGRIRRCWVLGDVEAVHRQLAAGAPEA